MRKLLMVVFLLSAAALPASAGEITIDSTNCNSSGGDCYGLSWNLVVNFVSGNTWEAILTVTDDPLAAPDSGQLISAVSFKATSSVDSATLIQAPTNLAQWTTPDPAQGLTAQGCVGEGNGMVCSQTLTAEATFSGTPLVWKWQFTTSET